MTNFFTAFLSAVANVFGWSLHRSTVKNAPDIKDSRERQKMQDAKTEFESAIRRKDIEAVRRGLAE
jgi:hypothetical protein